jgi:protein-tyrosine phosphatase
MFGFFSKKYFLVDYLKDFVDIHNHILPGIDDGAESPADSEILLKGLSDIGFVKFVATPHILRPLYPNTPETIRGAEQKLKQHLEDRNLHEIEVDSAAEHMIDDSFEEMIKSGDFMPLRDRYLLVEMSYLQPPLNLEEAIKQVKDIDLMPILAHPERYGFMHERYGQYRTLVDEGVLLQLNILSLGGYYGSSMQKIAFRLLEDNLVTFLASDLHNTRHLGALKEITLSQKQISLLEPVIRMTSESMY